MKRALLAAGTVAFLAFAGYATAAEEVDQIAQQKMIGLSKHRILACMGLPAKRVRIGATEIWTYPIGTARFESLFFAPALSIALPNVEAAAFPPGLCNVNVVMTNAAVSQVVYHSAGGGPLPLGEQCLFPVESCVEPFAVRARY